MIGKILTELVAFAFEHHKDIAEGVSDVVEGYKAAKLRAEPMAEPEQSGIDAAKDAATSAKWPESGLTRARVVEAVETLSPLDDPYDD